MALYATTADVEARWRPLSAEETATAETLLEDASLIVDTWVSDPDVGRAKIVVCAMVKRALSGPAGGDGVSAAQQTAGPFSQSLTFSNPMGNLYVTKADKRLLGVRGRAFAVDMMTGEVDVS